MKLFSHYIEHQRKRDPEIMNWKNHIVTDRLSYSFRDTLYDRSTFPSDFHYHDYYELVIFEEGEIRYLCDGAVYEPKYGDIVLIPPGQFHMSVIQSESTRYKRHVFYLYPSAFDAIGHGALSSFLLQHRKGILLATDSSKSKRKLSDLLWDLKTTAEKMPDPIEHARMLSYVIQVFCLLGRETDRPKHETLALPENVLALQRYIDENFAAISSVSQLAKHFFYSREYVSRLFRKYFDTTVSDYVTKRRVAESQRLLMEDLSIIEIADRVGFGSLSTFIRSFRSVTNMTPSEYRKLRKDL
ncbi:MAG: helix-turn-helix domain-containing protein [Ruminococcaceae bacterium]|nr:helix-turn-helix domain-containing protein [Oscillospiraceae bacterium]